jgi:hypothetical protein
VNATKVKSLAPLYGGVALLVIAVAGAALSLLSGNEGREKDPLDTGSVKPMPPVVPPVVPPVWATANPPAATPKVSAEELEARDKEELVASSSPRSKGRRTRSMRPGWSESVSTSPVPLPSRSSS